MYRKSEQHKSRGKREQRQIEIMPCPGCGSNHVWRDRHVRGQQKYRCMACGTYFLGEET